jgi:hypothetical protein
MSDVSSLAILGGSSVEPLVLRTTRGEEARTSSLHNIIIAFICLHL